MNFIHGTLDVLILNAIADRPLHGYDVVDWIRRATRDEIEIEDGALYTALHRMERRGWLAAEWRVSPKGRRAKYYRLTVRGQKELKDGQKHWTRFATAVSRAFAARGES